MYNSVGATALDQMKVTTLQGNLDQLIPGLAAVCLTLLVCKLLKRRLARSSSSWLSSPSASSVASAASCKHASA